MDVRTLPRTRYRVESEVSEIRVLGREFGYLVQYCYSIPVKFNDSNEFRTIKETFHRNKYRKMFVPGKSV
jgi:hypothetical protein